MHNKEFFGWIKGGDISDSWENIGLELILSLFWHMNEASWKCTSSLLYVTLFCLPLVWLVAYGVSFLVKKCKFIENSNLICQWINKFCSLKPHKRTKTIKRVHWQQNFWDLAEDKAPGTGWWWILDNWRIVERISKGKISRSKKETNEDSSDVDNMDDKSAVKLDGKTFLKFTNKMNKM